MFYTSINTSLNIIDKDERTFFSHLWKYHFFSMNFTKLFEADKESFSQNELFIHIVIWLWIQFAWNIEFR